MTYANLLEGYSNPTQTQWDETVYTLTDPFLNIAGSWTPFNTKINFGIVNDAPEHYAYLRLIEDAWNKNPEWTLKLMFHTYDVRGGKGLRDHFRLFVIFLDTLHQEVLLSNLHHIPFYGRWDMLIEIFNMTKHDDIRHEVLSIVTSQLLTDDMAYNADKSVSLCAKYMPRENNKPKVTRAAQWKDNFRKSLLDYANWTPRFYRKLISRLTNVVEQTMSENAWSKINYEHVPGKAMGKYGKNSVKVRGTFNKQPGAFYRHDPTRFTSFLTKAADGEVKMNAHTVSLVDMYTAIERGDTKLANAQWKNKLELPGLNALAIIDLSGSMTYSYRSPVAPEDIAMSVGPYISTTARGPFKNLLGVFATVPKFIKFDDNDSYSTIVNKIKRTNAGLTTELGKCVDYMLRVARKNDVAPEDMPEMIVLISDMEVNIDDRYNNLALGGFNKDALSKIKAKYAKYGYEMPMFVYWNAASSGKSIATQYTDNSIIVSGYDQNTINYITTGAKPMDLIVNIVNDERYDRLSVN